MVPLLPLRDGVRALPISFFRQSMPSFYMNAPDCICSPGRLPLGAFCTGRDGRYGQDWPTRCAFQSTHPVRGATYDVFTRPSSWDISIHAPRAGCDRRQLGGCQRHGRFQSTHPVRGATPASAAAHVRQRHFNPRTPCGVRPDGVINIPDVSDFNPRTPCGVRHYILVCPLIDQKNFNPRTPCGVRPLAVAQLSSCR